MRVHSIRASLYRYVGPLIHIISYSFLILKLAIFHIYCVWHERDQYIYYRLFFQHTSTHGSATWWRESTSATQRHHVTTVHKGGHRSHSGTERDPGHAESGTGAYLSPLRLHDHADSRQCQGSLCLLMQFNFIKSSIIVVVGVIMPLAWEVRRGHLVIAHLSVCLFVRNSVLLTDKLQYLKF